MSVGRCAPSIRLSSLSKALVGFCTSQEYSANSLSKSTSRICKIFKPDIGQINIVIPISVLLFINTKLIKCSFNKVAVTKIVVLGNKSF